MALVAATHQTNRYTNLSEKPKIYKSTPKFCGTTLTLGGVGRLPRVLHLEPKARAAARQESVRARPNPWRQPRCNTRAREDGGREISPWLQPASGRPRGGWGASAAAARGGKGNGAVGAREIM